MALPHGFTEVQGAAQTGGAPPAGFKDVSDSVDFGGVVKQALNEAMVGKGSKMRDLMIDPVTQAKALPYLMGTTLGVIGIPGGAALGTGGGHLLADAALKTYGRDDLIPPAGRQVLDTALAGAGDLTAVPYINRKIYGGMVGAVEKAAGVPAAQDIPSIPMTTGAKSAGDFINEAVDSVKSAGAEGSATYWKQIKDQVDRIYNLGVNQKLTGLDQGRLKWLNAMVQNGLNKAVPGREAPAAALAMSQEIPNAISRTVQSTPWWAKIAGSTAATAVGADTLLRALGHRENR